MEALHIERAHFLGQSMGGAIGQWLMIHAPERLDKVVLANTASYFPSAAGWNARIRSARENGMAELAPAVTQRWLTEAFRSARPEVAREIEAMLLACDPLGYAACCSALRDADLRDAIAAAPARPALVIVGENDASTPPELGVALADLLKDAKLVRLKAAHLSSVEAAEAFVAAVLGFLKG
jgi:3-oxoadipate enol-lactonase